MNKSSWLEDREMPFPSGYRAPNTKERILVAALRLISERGSEGFSLNEVLRRARVSKSSFFHHFRDTDALCLECFERCKPLVEPDLQATNYSSVEELLLDFGNETESRTTSRRFFRLIMFFGQRAMDDVRFRRIQIELTELYQQSLTSLILEIEPRYKKASVTEAVGFLLIISQGVASHRVLFEDRERMSRIWPHAVKAALGIMRS